MYKQSKLVTKAILKQYFPDITINFVFYVKKTHLNILGFFLPLVAFWKIRDSDLIQLL